MVAFIDPKKGGAMETALSISGLVGPPGAKLKEPSKENPGIRFETHRLVLFNAWCVRKALFPNAKSKLCSFEMKGVSFSEIPKWCPICGAEVKSAFSNSEEVIYAYG